MEGQAPKKLVSWTPKIRFLTLTTRHGQQAANITASGPGGGSLFRVGRMGRIEWWVRRSECRSPTCSGMVLVNGKQNDDRPMGEDGW